MRQLILGFVLLGLVFSMGCIETTPTETPPAQIPNPAAENCADKGYGYEIRTGAAGEYGICKYAGEECDEWDLYRGDCCFQDSDCTCGAGTTQKCENMKCTCETVQKPVEEVTEPEPQPEPEPEPVVIEHSDKTVGQFLNDSLAQINLGFYSEHPNGNYRVETYKWTAGSVDIKPNQLPIGGTGDTLVRFNGDKDRNLKGFGFKMYTPLNSKDEPIEGSLVEARAVGVFNSEFPLIHVYETNGMTIKIDYYPYSKTLYGCVIQDKEEYLASDDSHITLYYFYCVDTGPLVTT